METTETRGSQFGCQARPWIQTLGMPAFRERLPRVMRHIARLGFAGFETALPVLPLDDPQAFAQWQAEANGIRLAAAHTGGAWWETEADTQVDQTLEMAAKLPELGCDRLMVSIGAAVADLDAAGLDRLAVTLERIGARAASHGVAV
jgi:sugar phosphate isomerase/epimerase